MVGKCPPPQGRGGGMVIFPVGTVNESLLRAYATRRPRRVSGAPCVWFEFDWLLCYFSVRATCWT